MYGFFFCTLPVVWFGGRGFCALLCYAWNLYTTMTLSINITTLLPLQNDFDSFDALKILAFEAFSLQSQFWKTKRKSTHNSPGLLLPLTRLYPLGGAFSCMPWNMNAHMCPCHTNGTHTHTHFISSLSLCGKNIGIVCHCWTRMSPFIIIITDIWNVADAYKCTPLNWN